MANQHCTKCGRSRPHHIADPTCKQHGYCEWTDSPKQTRSVTLHPHEAQAIELAFVIEDPCREEAVTLAREIIRLIADRDEATIIALLGEVRTLQFKFWRGTACTGCGSEDCAWLWPSGRKCCSDCSHAGKWKP